MNWVQNMNRCVGPTEPPRNGTEKGTEMVDIVERLHYAGYNDVRLGEAAAEIERLRSAVNEHRNAAMEADLRTQAAVRGEKKALAEKVNLSELRRVMTEWHQRAAALGFDGVPDLIASIETGRVTQ